MRGRNLSDSEETELLHANYDAAVEAAVCQGCHYEDGSLNTEKLTDEGSCTFGCGRTVDRDTKFCGSCQDHSANQFTCDDCGTVYGDWEGKWTVVAATPAAKAPETYTCWDCGTEFVPTTPNQRECVRCYVEGKL